MAKYLVTGGAGFIGSHITEALLARGDEVRLMDNFATGREDNIRSFESRIDLMREDIRDKEAVARAVEGVDFVIHQAALASVQRSIDDPTSTNQVNVQGTLNILEAAHKGGVKRVVYASSSSVYGDSDVLPKVESMQPNPKSPYAISKLAGEWYCRVFSDIFGLPTVSLRYFNVFGPRQDPNSQYSAVIPIFVTALMKGAGPTIFGDGEQSRDFTFVENVVQANLLSCDTATDGAKVYNVACGQRFRLNSLYEKLQNITGVKEAATFGPPRPGDVKHSQAAIDLIEADLEYRVGVNFDEGLEKTVAWYRSAQ